jgi:phospholipid transport system substrate-binding protein
MSWKAQTAHKIWILLAGLTLATLFSSFVQAVAAESISKEDPQPLVSERINELQTRLRDNADAIRTDKSIAYQISDELIAPYIDFPRVTQLVIGKYWREASETQRSELIKQIRELLVRSYVTAMTSYIDDLVSKDNMVEFLPSRYKPGDRKASVRANIALGGRPAAEVQYQLYFRGQWKIYDIVIEGISLAITYRTSFGELIKRDGLDNLIAQLTERNRRGEVELPEKEKAAP